MTYSVEYQIGSGDGEIVFIINHLVLTILLLRVLIVLSILKRRMKGILVDNCLGPPATRQ